MLCCALRINIGIHLLIDLDRTLLTAQTVISSLFEIDGHPTMVPWHTGDYVLDPINGAVAYCPILHALSLASYRSPQFLSLNSSRRLAVSNATDAVFGAGAWNWMTAMDCVMTTVCSGRAIPDRSQTSQGPNQNMTSDLFNSIVSYSEIISGYRMLYNNSNYAKHFSGPLVVDLLENIQGVLNRKSDSIKFSIYGNNVDI